MVTVRRHAFDRLDSLPIEKASLLYSTDVMSDTANRAFVKVNRYALKDAIFCKDNKDRSEMNVTLIPLLTMV